MLTADKNRISLTMAHLVPSLIIMICVGICYSAVHNYGIIQLDDYQYLPGHLNEFSLKWAFTWAGDGMWTPLTWLSYMLDYSLWGECWGMYHVHSVLLHALSSVALYLILLKAARITAVRCAAIIALVATLLWALHPLRVESVAWLACRKDVLSTFFFLLALLSWSSARNGVCLMLSILLLTIGGLAKNSVMVFPAFAIVWDMFVARQRKPWWAYVTIVFHAITFAGIAAWAQGQGDAYAVMGDIPLWYRLINAISAETIYLVNLVWPTELAVQCQLRWPNAPRFSVVGFLMLSGVVYWFSCIVRDCLKSRAMRIGPEFAFLVVYFAALFPFLGIAGFGSHAFADRFTILPTIALSIAYVMLISKLRRRGQICLLSLGLLAILPLGLLTIGQVSYWEDDRHAFEHTLLVDGETNMIAHKVLMLDAWEFDHDLDRVFRHAYAVRHAASWQQDMIMVLAFLGVEAAYETGRIQEAREMTGWTIKWSAQKVREHKKENPFLNDTVTGLIVEVVRRAYTEGQLENARALLAEIEEGYPDHFAVKNLRYLIARRGGDRKEIAETKTAAYSVKGNAFIHNRWVLAD